MANKFNLGLNLGQMLSGVMDKTNSQKGYQDGMRTIEYQTSADLNRAKVGETESNTALKNRQLELQTDDALKRVARLNQGFSDGMEIPQDKISDNNKQLANLLFAVGADNKSLDLQKMTQGIQRNNITADLTPQNAYEKSLQASVLEPNVNPLEIRKATLTDSIANSGAPNANENALLLSQGKTPFSNMGSDGTFNQITGTSTINPQAIKAEKQTDYNKPFLPDGSANLPYQEYEKNKKNVEAEAYFSDMVDYGLPKPQTPWANTADSKARDRFKQKEYEIARKKLDTFGEEVDKYKSLSSRADRFLELNNKIATGGMLDKVPGGQFVQSFGSDYAEMQSITADLVPEMREKGSGATSDFDAKMFQRATVGVDKPGGANQNIVKAIKGKAQLVSDRQDFLNAYLEQNGTLAGADWAWKKYAEANPIFDKSKNDFTLNGARQDWNSYFSQTQPASNNDAAKPTNTSAPVAGAKQIKRTGTTKDGRKVTEYPDGTREFK